MKKSQNCLSRDLQLILTKISKNYKSREWPLSTNTRPLWSNPSRYKFHMLRVFVSTWIASEYLYLLGLLPSICIYLDCFHVFVSTWIEFPNSVQSS
jgi:hypothetical protein